MCIGISCRAAVTFLKYSVFTPRNVTGQIDIIYMKRNIRRTGTMRNFGMDMEAEVNPRDKVVYYILSGMDSTT